MVSTVTEYLQALPEDRRAVIADLRDLILRHLPAGYQEEVRWGMICYEVPLERYPDTYNGQPLGYLALAAQKKHFSLYLMGVCQDPEQDRWLREEFARAGKRLDMGKACLRFQKPEDLPLQTIAEAVASTPPERLIERYEQIRRR